MKTCINGYKNLFMLSLVIFISCIQAQEKSTDKSFQRKKIVETINPFKKLLSRVVKRKMSRGPSLSSLDISIKQTKTSILNAVKNKYEGLNNRITNLTTDLAALAVVVNNLPIVLQLGVIYTSAASSSLTIQFVVTDPMSSSLHNVDLYNAAIRTALTDISTALHNPSKNNTTIARSALAIAIDYFDIIDCLAAVSSCNSIADIHKALMQLNAQLAYLYLLQTSS